MSEYRLPRTCITSEIFEPPSSLDSCNINDVMESGDQLGLWNNQNHVDACKIGHGRITEKQNGKSTEVTVYSSGYPNAYETTSRFRDGQLVSCSMKNARPSSMTDLRDSIAKPDPFLGSRRASNHSMMSSTKKYRTLKTMDEIWNELQKRKVLKRVNEFTGNPKSLQPISIWKYVEYIPDCEKNVSRQTNSISCTSYFGTLPVIKEENNPEEQIKRKQEKTDGIVFEPAGNILPCDDPGRINVYNTIHWHVNDRQEPLLLDDERFGSSYSVLEVTNNDNVDYDLFDDFKLKDKNSIEHEKQLSRVKFEAALLEKEKRSNKGYTSVVAPSYNAHKASKYNVSPTNQGNVYVTRSVCDFGKMSLNTEKLSPSGSCSIRTSTRMGKGPIIHRNIFDLE